MIPANAIANSVKTIKKGQPAPYSGVIYSTEAHAKLVSKLKRQDEQKKLELQTALDKQRIQLEAKLGLFKIDLSLEKQKHELTTKHAKNQRDFLLKELKKSKDTPWYKSQTFAFIGGILLSTGLLGLSVYAFNKIGK